MRSRRKFFSVLKVFIRFGIVSGEILGINVPQNSRKKLGLRSDLMQKQFQKTKIFSQPVKPFFSKYKIKKIRRGRGTHFGITFSKYLPLDSRPFSKITRPFFKISRPFSKITRPFFKISRPFFGREPPYFWNCHAW